MNWAPAFRAWLREAFKRDGLELDPDFRRHYAFGYRAGYRQGFRDGARAAAEIDVEHCDYPLTNEQAERSIKSTVQLATEAVRRRS